MEKSHTVLFTKNKEADLVSMIAAEVCIYHTKFRFINSAVLPSCRSTLEPKTAPSR